MGFSSGKGCTNHIQMYSSLPNLATGHDRLFRFGSVTAFENRAFFASYFHKGSFS